MKGFTQTQAKKDTQYPCDTNELKEIKIKGKTEFYIGLSRKKYHVK